jgi:hypothetical protein
MPCELDRLLNKAAKGVTSVTLLLSGGAFYYLAALDHEMVIGSRVILFTLIPLPVPVWLMGWQWRFASLLEAAEPEA